MSKDAIERIAEALASGTNNILFSGAGISTESGIPDYRSQGGLWDRYRPVTFDRFMASRKARIEYWRQRTEMQPALRAARPNKAHLAVAKLFASGMIRAVITQNIDGLHQAAGVAEDRVIELHGNTRRISCLACRKRFAEEEVFDRIKHGDSAPDCDCGGHLKPETVSFGQAMPREMVLKAETLSQTCSAFIVVGSTLLVYPAAQMPAIAKQSGGFLAIVNLSETPCDPMADVRIQAKAGVVLPAVADAAMRR